MLTNLDDVEIETQIMNLLLVFLAILLVPCVIYGLSRLGVFSPGASDLMLGGFAVVCGVLFLSVGVFVFMQSGYLLHPSKHGPTSLPPDSDWFSKLAAIAMSLLLGVGVIWAGIDVIRKKNKSR